MASKTIGRKSRSELQSPQLNTLARALSESGRDRFPLFGFASVFVLNALVPTPAMAQTTTPTPPLPTACPAGACPDGRSFVQSGTIGNGGAPVINGSTLTVNQASNNAVLNWQNFNIANGYSVRFNLPGSTSATLNQIWNGNPSVIAGNLTSNGQIYLINQSGIVFAQGAQVNVGGLTASAIPLDATLFQNGILSNNSGNFATSASSRLNPTFFDPNGGAIGTVSVNAGANLSAASGGRILLLGSRVTNQGNISTPDGQTILGAGEVVYLAASTDPAARGLLIEVKSTALTDTTVADPNAANASTVVNQGQITAARGNVTLAGLVVNQAGRITATSSVSANGSIYLVAGDTSGSGDFYQNVDGGVLGPNNGGTLRLSSGSVTEILADPDDQGRITTAGEAGFIAPEVRLTGKTVLLQQNASIRAPGAEVVVTAAANPFNNIAFPSRVSNTPDGSRITLESGSSIDVSGLRDVPVDVTRNLVTVRLGGRELQDAPLLRDGFLRGRTVVIDVRQGSTLFDITPYRNNITHGIAEELTRAGSINLNSGGDVITRAGSILNVSGGSIAYTGGIGPSTTRLIGANGRVYDVANAPGDLPYVGFANSYSYTDFTYGTITTVTPRRVYAGYTQGADAGSIRILAPQSYLRGSLLGQTVNGLYQRTASTLAKAGTFELGDRSQISSVLPDFRAPEVSFANVLQDTLGAGFTTLGANPSSLPTDLAAVTQLSASQLSAGGFGTVNIYSNGNITVPAAVDLKLAGNGAFTAVGQAIEIAGRITAPGSAVSLTSRRTINSTTDTLNDVTLAAGGVIDVSGGWVNDSPTIVPRPGTDPVLIDGGSVTINAQRNVALGQGSRIDVSGGGWLDSHNDLTAGKGGDIALSGLAYDGGGTALLGASLAGGQGGTLSLRSTTITIGNREQGTQGELLLVPQLFSQGGFRSYSVTGVDGVNIGSASDAVNLRPIEQNLTFIQNARFVPTGTRLSTFTRLQTLPDSQRSAASIRIATATSAISPGIGDIVLAQGSSITTEAGGSISLSTGRAGNIDIQGSLIAPAGSISLQIGTPTGVAQSGDPGFIEGQQIHLGSEAVLSATGIPQIFNDNRFGYRLGQILDGGTISLQANKGFVVTDEGSLIDVHGVASTLDIATSGGLVPTTVYGNAGTVRINAREGIVLQGDLNGRAAGFAGAGGGSLSIGLDLYNDGVTRSYIEAGNGLYPTDERILTLSSRPASELDTSLTSGSAQISTQTLRDGGFDNISVKSTDVIAFAAQPNGSAGQLSLSAKGNLVLDAPVLRGADNASVSLSGTTVTLGNGSGDPAATQEQVDPSTPGYLPPVQGLNPATLRVSAQLIDVRGNSRLDNFSDASLNSTGDIRLSSGPDIDPANVFSAGSLSTAGDLHLNAAQIYPTTATTFAINSPGTVAIGKTGTSATPAVPLSAGGNLTINAHLIEQSGVLRAPLGQIVLNAVDGADGSAGSVVLTSGSLTSVSAEGQLIPFGSTQNGLQYTYDGSPVGVPPAKQVQINGASVDIASGATVDLSGGGDLYAYEFIAGPGGSQDVLNPANGVYTYAILPSLNSGSGGGYAPIDSQYALNTNIATGRTIYLSGVPGLPDGNYALLPPRYALLPGAFAVQVVQSNSDLAAGTVARQSSGSLVVAGRFGIAGTGVLDSRTSTVLLAPTTVVRAQSQFNDSSGNTFFAQAAASNGSFAPPLPADAGQLQLKVTKSLTEAGTIAFATGSYVVGQDAQGRDIVRQGLGGDVEIAAPKITVVDTLNQPGVDTDSLQLTAATLANFNAQTLILGATSTATANGQQLNVVAESVTLSNSATELRAPEVILAATDAVTLDANSALRAEGTLNESGRTLLVSGDGALLRVSAGAPVTLSRTNTTAAGLGTVNIGSGATVAASGSLLLDSPGTPIVAADATITAPAVTLSSSRISLGNAPTGTEGINLSDPLLDTLRAGGLTDLTLLSRSTVDFYDGVTLGALDGSGQPQLRSITLDSGGLGGFGIGDTTLLAGTITLVNSNHVAAGAFQSTPDGTGNLDLQASAITNRSGSGQLVLGEGDKTISGFGAVRLGASGEIQGQGTGTLTLANAGDLTLQSARLGTDSGATQTIDNGGGAVSIVAATAASPISPSAIGVGGKLTIAGTSITQSGVIDLPSGILELHARTGDIELASGSSTRAAGTALNFHDSYAVAGGGQINLVADQGSINLGSGATLDVSGAISPDGSASGNAGALSVTAANGQFLIDGGTLNGGAAAGRKQGDFTLDTGVLASFSALNSALASGGFTGAVAERVRGGDVDITVADTVRASSFVLSADGGSINVAGTIDTHGGDSLSGDGGAIALWAGTGLSLAPSATLDASAGAAGPGGRAAQGGNITLATRSGSLDLGSPTIRQRGGADAGTDGRLTLRAPRTDDNADVAIQPLTSSAGIDTRKAIVVEGVKTYAANTLGSGADSSTNLSTEAALVNSQDGTTPNSLFADTSSFAGQSSAISTRLGLNNAEIRAGIEVASAGDLQLTDAWDLSQWHFDETVNGVSAAVPINLSLRAAGQLIFDGSLSDGFDSSAVTASLGTGNSASYRLSAGSDIDAANPLSVIRDSTPGGGDFALNAGNLIRTGNGDIDIAAGGDIRLGVNADGSPQTRGQTAVIYTAGLASSGLDPVRFPVPVDTNRRPVPAFYPTEGGNLSIDAGGDIRSAPSDQLISDWLWRRGAVDSAGRIITNQNTTWFIRYDQFQQGVGALGGGNVRVNAGRDVVNLSAVVPSTGRLQGEAGSLPSRDNLVINGGGSLEVLAGRDIVSGVFEADRGNARISAGGSLSSGGRTVADTSPNSPFSANEVFPILVVGDEAGSFDVSARKALQIQAAVNSTVLPQSTLNQTGLFGRQRSYFYTYAPESSLNLVSAGGDVTLTNNTETISALAPRGRYDLNFDPFDLSVYPSTLNASALSGSIDVPSNTGATINLFPSAIGNATLLAAHDVAAAGGLRLLESDPSQASNPLLPTAGVFSTAGRLQIAPLPLRPLHEADDEPVRIIAETGNITEGTFVIPKAAELRAGGNIENITYTGKNLRPSDVTLFEAGGDISFGTPTDPRTNALIGNSRGIEIGGPGFVEVLAGGNLDLGNSNGVVTSGSFNDSRLSSGGATVVAAAGLGTTAPGDLRQPSYQAFTDTYLASTSGTRSLYAEALLVYLRKLYPDLPAPLNDAAALASFRALAPSQQLPFLAQVLNAELSATGIDHNQLGTSYDRGYLAIDTLFPTLDSQGQAIRYAGDINLFFSQLKTQQGGNIQLLAPGGSVVVGLPNPPAALNSIKTVLLSGGNFLPPEANLGLLVFGAGAIQGFANDSFNVNQSRVLTLQGGDIILWASNGDIDAGRGERTASATPPPVIQTDANGNVFVNPSNSVAGSGIGQLVSRPGDVAGQVALIAPRGTVDAGDAGIRVAGNLTIAALQVLGADNITVGGTSSGVPTSGAGANLGALSGASALGDSSKNATDQIVRDVADTNADNQKLADSLTPSFVVVKAFCLGDECPEP